MSSTDKSNDLTSGSKSTANTGTKDSTRVGLTTITTTSSTPGGSKGQSGSSDLTQLSILKSAIQKVINDTLILRTHQPKIKLIFFGERMKMMKLESP